MGSLTKKNGFARMTAKKSLTRNVQPFLEELKNKYKDETLKVGTKIYHGSRTDVEPVKFKNQVFFGLEPIISIWYCLELEEKSNLIKKSKQRWFSNVHE